MLIIIIILKISIQVLNFKFFLACGNSRTSAFEKTFLKIYIPDFIHSAEFRGLPDF